MTNSLQNRNAISAGHLECKAYGEVFNLTPEIHNEANKDT